MVYFTYLLIHIFFIFLALLYGLFLMFFNPLKLEEIHQNSYSFDGLLYAFLYHRYASTLQLTQKIDIFSFGVVLLEALCGQPPILKDTKTKNADIHIVEWVLCYKLSRNYIIVEQILKKLCTCSIVG